MSGDYIRTTTNLVSRKAQIQGPQRVEMRGRSIVQEGVSIRGDLAIIRVGHYCFFDQGVQLRPCSIIKEGVKTPVPMTIGNLTHIGKGCMIEAAYIGSNVEIGENCIISSRCIIKDCCKIQAGTIIPPDAVIPPFALVSGQPGRIIGELPPSTPVSTRQTAVSRYRQIKKRISIKS